MKAEEVSDDLSLFSVPDFLQELKVAPGLWLFPDGV